MKTIAAIFFLLAFFTALAFGQSVKTIGFNTTNGEVIANTGTNSLTFTNGVGFTTNAAAVTRTNLGLGATWLTNTNRTNFVREISGAVVNPLDAVVSFDTSANSVIEIHVVNGIVVSISIDP